MNIRRLCNSILKYSTSTYKPRKSSCNVTVLGADTLSGELLSFLLKQNPLISVLNLQGSCIVKGISEDLHQIDTGCKVQTHSGVDNCNALKSADVVVLLNDDDLSEKMSLGDRVMKNGGRVCRLSAECAKYSPRAIIVVCAQPVSVMVPLVAKMYKQTPWYHPGRIIGCTTSFPLIANTTVARYQSLDPFMVDVPLCGGPDLDCIVPLFSKASPCPLDTPTALKLTAQLRGINASEFLQSAKPKNVFFKQPHLEAHAISRLVTTIAFGVHGDDTAVGYGFVRYSASYKHLVTLVKFSKQGVVHNYGIPILSKLEQDLVERSAAIIYERDHIADEFLEYYLSTDKEQLPNFLQKEINEGKSTIKKAVAC